MEAFREPFAAFNRDGFQFLPDLSRSADRTHGWVGPGGNELTDAERDSLLVGKQRGDQFKRLPFNDPTVEFDRPNPIAPLARNVFGQHAVAAPPGSDWYARPMASKAELERQPMSTNAETPDATLAATQIAQSAPTPHGPNASQQPKPIMPIPAYRAQTIGQQGKAWNSWSSSVRNLPNISVAEEKAYMEIFAAEGGNRSDASSTAVSGILQGTMDELSAKGYVKGIRSGMTPKQLQARGSLSRLYRLCLKKCGWQRRAEPDR
jgi:hypothetical protein